MAASGNEILYNFTVGNKHVNREFVIVPCLHLETKDTGQTRPLHAEGQMFNGQRFRRHRAYELCLGIPLMRLRYLARRQ